MPAHGQQSSVSKRLYDKPTSTWMHPDAFHRKYPQLKHGAVDAPTYAPAPPCPGPIPAAPQASWPKVSTDVHDSTYVGKVLMWDSVPAVDPVVAAEEALREAKQQAKEKAAAERAALAAKEAADAKAATEKALRERLAHEAGLASATCQIISDVRNLLLGGLSEVRANTAYAEYVYELQPLAKSYGCKIIPVGDRKQGTLVVLP